MENKSSFSSEGEFSLHTAYIKDVTLTKLSYTFQKRRLWWKTQSHSRISFYSFIFTGVRYVFRRPLRVSPPEIETLTSSRLYSEESARCNKFFDCALWPLTLSEKRRSFSIQLFKLVCAAHELISDWVCVVSSCLLTIQRFHQEMHLIQIFVTSCSFMNSVLHFPLRSKWQNWSSHWIPALFQMTDVSRRTHTSPSGTETLMKRSVCYVRSESKWNLRRG